jgi:vacuolar-type H+-ATPase subunit I/STV1
LVIDKANYTTPFESEDECPKELNNIVGEKVKIKSIKKEGMDSEDYYYLKKYEHRTGTISEKNKSKSGKYTYKIEFAQNSFGYFYQEDFILIYGDQPTN